MAIQMLATDAQPANVALDAITACAPPLCKPETCRSKGGLAPLVGMQRHTATLTAHALPVPTTMNGLKSVAGNSVCSWVHLLCSAVRQRRDSRWACIIGDGVAVVT